MRLIADAHLDLAWNALQWSRDLTLPLEALRAAESHMTDHRSRGRATISLPAMREARVAVCLTTILSRAKPSSPRPTAGFNRFDLDHPNQTIAAAVGLGQLAYYELLERCNEVRILRTAADFREHVARWTRPTPMESTPLPIGVILAMEGADPILDLPDADTWWARGLRCVGLAHYGDHPYAAGTGSSGPVTQRGRALLRKMDDLGIILDLTHCAEPGFFEALDLFGGPVIASHNLCRALVPGDRQLSDMQLHAVIARDGVIGVAADAWMLAPGYQRGITGRDTVSLSHLADHIDHICQLAGDVRYVVIGSDLDGGYGNEQTPHELDSVVDLHRLDPLLAARGYSSDAVDAIFSGNLIRFLCNALPSDICGSQGESDE